MDRKLLPLEPVSEIKIPPDELIFRLRAKMDVSVLSEAITTRSVLHIPGLISGIENAFPTYEDLHRALIMNVFKPEDLRIYARRFELDQKLMGIVQDGRIQSGVVSALAQQGATLVFNKVDLRDPTVKKLAEALEEWLQDPIEIGMFASFCADSGLNVHHDTQNLLIFQLMGSKCWTFHGDLVEVGLPLTKINVDHEIKRKIIIHKGDVLFVPAGYRHHCNAEGFSLHLGVAIRHGTGQLLSNIISQTFESDPRVLEPVLALLGRAHAREVAERYRTRIQAIVDAMDIVGILEQERKRRLRRQ